MSVIRVSGLVKEYGTLRAVDGVSFTAEAGEIVGLIGPNGAGKTTLIRVLATLLEPTDGEIAIGGFDVRRDVLAVRRAIGYVPDFFNLYHDLTIRECLTFFARAYDVSPADIPGRIERALRDVALEEKADEFILHLSRGMVQKLGLACLLVRRPRLFLLDEPASGLDPSARRDLRDVLTRLGKEGATVVISSHILTELADFCTHVLIMDRGRFVRQGPIEGIRRPESGPRVIRIVVRGEATAAAAVLNGIAGMTVGYGEAGHLTVTLDADAPGLADAADINRLLVSHGIPVCGLSEDAPSLEDVFLLSLAHSSGPPHDERRSAHE